MKYKIIAFIATIVMFSCKEKKTAINSIDVKAIEKPNILFVLVDDLGLYGLNRDIRKLIHILEFKVI